MRQGPTTEFADESAPATAAPADSPAEQADNEVLPELADQQPPPLQMVPPGSAGVVLPANGPFPRVLAALNYRNFTLLMSGALIHHIGWWMCMMTINWLAFALSDSPLLLTFTSMAMGATALLTLPLGGTLADHMNRRHLLIATYVAGALLTLAAAVLAWRDALTVWHLIILTALIGVTHGLRFPAYNALLPSLVDHRDLHNAIGVNTLQFQFSRVIGPVIGGLVLGGALGAAGNFTFFSVGCGIIIISLLRMRNVPPAPGMGKTLIGGLVHGLSYVRRRSDLIMIFVLATFATGLIAPMTILLAAFIKGHLRHTEQDFALLMGCAGLGAMCGAGLQVVRIRNGNSARRFVWPLVAMGASQFAAGFCNSFLLMIPLVFINTFAFAGLIVITKSAIATTTPNHLQGRMSSYLTIAFHIGGPLGAGIAGTLAENFGLLPVYRTFGIAAFVIVLVILVASRYVRPVSQPQPQ